MQPRHLVHADRGELGGDYARNRRFQFWRRAQETAKPVETMANVLASKQLTPEDTTVLKQQVEAVWSSAAVLPVRQRTVFLLRFVEEMSLLEIAAVTGMKEGTVKTHLFRALQTIRGQIGTER